MQENGRGCVFGPRVFCTELRLFTQVRSNSRQYNGIPFTNMDLF